MDLIDLGKCCVDDGDFICTRIFIRLAGNKDSHKSSDEFDFGEDRTIYVRVSCPLVSHRHIMGSIVVRTTATSFLSHLHQSQITKTGIKSGTSSILVDV